MGIVDSKSAPDGSELPTSVWGRYREGGALIGFKVKWREPVRPGVYQQRSHTVVASASGWKSALAEAERFLRGAQGIAHRGEKVARPGHGHAVTLDELFDDWVDRYASRQLSPRYVTDSARLWGREVSPVVLGDDGARTFGDLTLSEIMEQPAWLVAYQEALDATGLGDATRRKILFLIRGVLERGQRWYPEVLTRNAAVSMFEMPSGKRRRLVRAPSLIAVHRIRESILARATRDPLRPLIEAALVATMGETIALRPSELLHSARWEDLHERTLWLQRSEDAFGEDDAEPGLKTGARGTRILPTAREDLLGLRNALEERFGAQPDHGLIFQKLGRDGPLWTADGESVGWTLDDYKRFTERVYRPARLAAAAAKDVAAWVARMRFYDLRHGAVSLALHGGMPQHLLTRYSGHSEKTLNDVYSHIIKEYEGQPNVDMAEEARKARAYVAAHPHRYNLSAGPQNAQQRRRRARRASESARPKAGR